MLFNSIDFAIFLPLVFLTYWFLAKRNRELQNIVVLISSYIFYGWWDWRFLSLIIISSTVDYLVGRGLSASSVANKRKLLLLLSVSVNIGFLGFFKYFNFFIDNFVEVYHFFGKPINPQRLNIILPVGISFYTFQTLSYSIDVYRKKFTPTKDIIAFFAYVSFFPQLVAGPIERATNLLPQFYNTRIFEYRKAVDGLRQILWGFFKKIVIADNCAFYVNEIFSNYTEQSSITLFLGAFFFAFQIYADFSGYSDIAIGTARLFGFNLMRNFAFPYFSRDIAEFWRRWHISLSTWFRDYIYIPLGGSRVGTWKNIRNIFIIFIVSGFWHGANWTFIAWGALNAIYFIPLMLMKTNRNNLRIVAQGKFLPSIRETIRIIATFLLTLIGWIFFRSETIYDSIQYLKGLFSLSIFTIPSGEYKRFLIILIIFIFVEWIQREKMHVLQLGGFLFRRRAIRFALYIFILLFIYYMGSFDNHAFIYFQF